MTKQYHDDNVQRILLLLIAFILEIATSLLSSNKDGRGAKATNKIDRIVRIKWIRLRYGVSCGFRRCPWQVGLDIKSINFIISCCLKYDNEKLISVSLTVCCFVVYSTRRFVVCLAVCHFVLVFFSPFSIGITSLGEERANLSAFRTFVRFVLV